MINARSEIHKLYRRIVDYNSAYELRDFSMLTQQDKDKIFENVYQSLKNYKSEDDENPKDPQEMFLERFFFVLHANGLTVVTSQDAAIMYRIYNKAICHYPEFEECSYSTQINILHEAFMKGRLNTHHDIYVYSKATFLVLADRNLINTIVITVDEITKRFNKVYERRDYENATDVGLIYVGYERRTQLGVALRTSFHVSDLWNLLAEGFTKQN